jgi:hypothetical protein
MVSENYLFLNPAKVSAVACGLLDGSWQTANTVLPFCGDVERGVDSIQIFLLTGNVKVF